MKKVLMFLVMLMICCCTTFAQHRNRVYAKVVVDTSGKLVGRYLGTHAKSIRVGVNDSTEIEVPNEGYKVVTYSAYNGQGYVYGISKIEGKVRQRMDATSPILLRIKVKDGEKPVCYPCLGLDKYGWFKILVDGKTGYIREEVMEWTPMEL